MLNLKWDSHVKAAVRRSPFRSRFPAVSRLSSLFQISLLNFYKVRVLLLEKLHLQPTELDLLPFYEYEFTLEIYNDLLKERNKQEQQQTQDEKDKYNMDNMAGQAKRQMSNVKVPNMPSMPKISMPKL